MSTPTTSHMGRGSQKVSHGHCKSIQCATCYPRLGEAYNEAIRARREEGAQS